MATKAKRKSRSKSKADTANSPKRGRGRPSDFRPEYCEQAEKLCKLLNADDTALAAFFEVTETTIGNWKQRHPEFLVSIKRGKAVADIEIAHSFHERARGYEWQEAVPIKLKTVEYADGKRVRESERVEIVMVTKRQPADVTAGIFWMKNRQPETWRDKHDVTHAGAVDVNLGEVRGGIASKLDRIAAALEAASVPRQPNR
jgi:hypothetical protein